MNSTNRRLSPLVLALLRQGEDAPDRTVLVAVALTELGLIPMPLAANQMIPDVIRTGGQLRM